MKEVRSRGWCFTINNYTEDDMAYVHALYEDNPECEYLIMGFEVAPRTKTPHIQGFIYYKNPLRFSAVRKLFEPNHVEPQKSKSPTAAYCYCMEEGDYYEIGDRPRQGHRTDLEVIKHDIKNNISMKVISNRYFSQWCQYRKAFDEFRRINMRYKTELHVYDSSEDGINYSMKYIHDNYDMTSTYLVLKEWLYDEDILPRYYSGQYSHILIPSGTWSKHITQNITYVIEDENKTLSKV